MERRSFFFSRQTFTTSAVQRPRLRHALQLRVRNPCRSKTQKRFSSKTDGFSNNGVVVFPFFDGIFEYFEIIEIFEYLVCFQ